MRRGREASPMRRRSGWLHCGARIKQRSASPDVCFAAQDGLKTDIVPCPKSARNVCSIFPNNLASGLKTLAMQCKAVLVELFYLSIFELHIHCKPFMKLKRQ